MSNVIRFTATKLNKLGKKGVIKPDEDGYYTLIVGALNCYNSRGEYYTLDAAKKLFESSSILMRRIQNGELRGEIGHPQKLPGSTDREYIQRILTIDESKVICHFKEIWLDYNYAKTVPDMNNDTVVIMAKLKPAGPYGHVLKESLDNPNENTSFSIRSLTNNRLENGIVVKNIVNIITWDYVNEPGISKANKWDSPATESEDFSIATEEMLSGMVEDKSIVANESSRILLKDTLDKLKKEEKPIYYNL